MIQCGNIFCGTCGAKAVADILAGGPSNPLGVRPACRCEPRNLLAETAMFGFVDVKGQPLAGLCPVVERGEE